MKPDDLRIPNAFEEAKKAGLRYTIDGSTCATRTRTPLCWS